MPELPEVETVKRVLEPQLKGRTILSVCVERPEVVAHPAAEEFSQAVAGQIITGMTRRGKFLGMTLQSGDRILLHLRMTGCFLAAPADAPEEKHTHVVFVLDNGTELRFSDSRRFGRFWLVRAGEPDRYSGAEKLGPEPFDDSLTAEYLQNCFGKRKKAIKDCLLEQSAVAGIGNIYSDEILFAAHICPTRAAASLTYEEWERLAVLIPEKLAYFIEKNIPTPEEYWKGKGQEYRNTPFLQVYNHNGEPCPLCGATLVRTVIGGRSSVYCPACQK